MNNKKSENNDQYDTNQTKPNIHSKKTRITIRIDTDTLDWFKEQAEKTGNERYQTKINKVLCDYIKNHNSTQANGDTQKR